MRDRRAARLTELLASRETRLVTLTGPGGSEKTRLAIAVAARLQVRFEDAGSRAVGVTFVPLADLTDGAHFPEAIADALRLARTPGSTALEQVVTLLRSRRWLLVLDSFEHLVEEGTVVVRRLRERLPYLTCLVTSRQRLELAGVNASASPG